MEDNKTTVDFMKLMDFMQGQKQSQHDEMVFRENYRKKSIEPSKKQYKSSTFIHPRGPTPLNLLSSSAAFRTMTA